MFNVLRSTVSGSLALAALTLCVTSAQAITVTTSGDALALANTLVAPGSGITIVSASYTGAPVASGTFSDGGNIGIASGVILTSGNANLAVGPNDSDSAGESNGLPGDPDLDTLTGGATFDASALTINFLTSDGSISFNYVFASEEYPEFVGSFNDGFGFFVNGVNIALLPGTNTPVTINNVNESTNSSFFRINYGTLTNTINTQYDGLTTVLTATITGLSTTQTNTLKFAVADALDTVLDSAVFLQGNSVTTVIPEPATPLAGLALLVGGAMVLRRRKQTV